MVEKWDPVLGPPEPPGPLGPPRPWDPHYLRVIWTSRTSGLLDPLGPRDLWEITSTV